MFAGSDFGTQYFAGYIVEKSLSVDNLFVFVIIMTTFAVPEEHQHKVLTFGIIIALILRAIFIVLGAALLELFAVMFLLFGILLIYTAIQLFRHRDQDPGHPGQHLRQADPQGDPGDRRVPRRQPVHPDRRQRFATPLFIVLIAIGSTDILFALDSIPAVFGVTAEPYIVFVANAFALLGLRALFFLVKGLLDRLVYLSTGLAIILAFIGVKLILHWAHGIWPGTPEISTNLSLVGDRGGADGHHGGQPDQEPAAIRPPRRTPVRCATTPSEATARHRLSPVYPGPLGTDERPRDRPHRNCRIPRGSPAERQGQGHLDPGEP